ncbi:MAG: DNA-formamidopyrimidine glycosylase family protein [Polaromonas sp.]|nr:DNA-formamidopyrimidine glycosylase family protein [Polaromonas sp.]
MPEGPSIVIATENMAGFTGKKITRASGTAAIDMAQLAGRRIASLRSWGKHFLIDMDDVTVRIHFLMFGTYLINEKKALAPKLSLHFSGGQQLNFYTCAVKLIDGPLEEAYDWSADVLSDHWDARAALRKLQAAPTVLACDALLDQTIFSGVGNIIKNEVLFRVHVHPLSQVGAVPARRLRVMVDDARDYSFDFLAWKKAGVLKKHWLAHTREICPRCVIPFSKAHLGKTRRRSFFCECCQQNYQPA